MSAELALTRPEHELTMDSLRAQMEAAKRWVDSGMLPAAIKTPQQALTIMSVGREIGVPPTYALRNIHVIGGKPTCSAELLMALVRRTYGQSAIRVREATNDSCTVEYREAGWDGVSSLTFSIADAKQAGLASRDMWKQYPRAMLRSRAVSETVRTAFPECISGLYTPEELGAQVRVTADGAVELVDSTPSFDSHARSGPLTTESALAPASVARIGPAVPAISTPDDVTRWLHAWFSMVPGTSLGSDAAREKFVADWTREWPKSRQTNSLRRMFSFMRPDDARDVLDHVRALIDAERREAMDRDVMALENPDDEEHI